MHKTKKKTKTAKLPKPIKVKKEKSDEDRLPQPMTHYIDDRLEMVKQIFGTLKPKTIINLAPDFLKVKEMDEIEEACLNELLCISTKRLNSIITSTRCPTDTESSDNESDVERQEEHISLEEISSGSEIGGGASKKGKKKKSLKSVDTAESTAKKNAPKVNEAGTGDGQISVLELLELQARARAIRSQLALEPVTKIEVDSDEDKRNDGTTEKKSTKSDRKRLSSERESKDSAKVSKTIASSEKVSPKTNDKDIEKLTTKKIKIKRNYRAVANQDKDDVPKENENTKFDKEMPQEKEKSKEKQKESKSNRKKDEKSKERGNNKKENTAVLKDIKKEKTSRSPSPDVIPIVPEPETLLISDSSDEAERNENIKETTTETKEKPKEKLADKSLDIEATKEKQRERKNTDTEERGLGKLINSGKDDQEKSSSQKCNTAEKQDESRAEENCSTEDNNNHDSEPTKSDQNDSPAPEIERQNKKKDEGDHNDKPKKSNDDSNSTNNSDDDHNDDLISLGGDLENEMNEQLENEVNAIKSPREDRIAEESSQEANKSQNEDVISLESSEDEKSANNQSWHSRYMKSSKVSKVLATSRLGKRVRDKIRKSKRSKKETSRENSESEKEKSTPSFTSKHEDGSVEQYKELLEIRQRKSS